MANANITVVDSVDQTITGTALDDTLTIAGANAATGTGDTYAVNAGTGDDTLVLTGVSLTADGAATSNTEGEFDGSDVLVGSSAVPANQDQYDLDGVEFIEFFNGTLDLSATALAPQVILDTTGEVNDTVGLFHQFVVETPLLFNGTSVTKGDDFSITAINGNAVIEGSSVVVKDAMGVIAGTVSVIDNSSDTTLDEAKFTVEDSFRNSLGFGQTADVTFSLTVEDMVSLGATDIVSEFTKDFTVTITGGFSEGADVFSSATTDNTGADQEDGLGGDDFMVGGKGADELFGNGGNDQIWAGADDDAADIFIGGDDDDIIGGGFGDDVLVGDSHEGATASLDLGDVATDDGSDAIFGGDGKDTIVTGNWDDSTQDLSLATLDGTTATTLASGKVSGTMADIAWGGAGDDKIAGADGGDTLGGGDGVDYIWGNGGDDIIFGGGDDAGDFLYAGSGNDEIYGGGGSDNIDAGIGDDEIWGGAGDDVMIGGGADTDIDTFGFAADHGNDTINDFEDTFDLLDVSELGFTAMTDMVISDNGTDTVIHTSDDSSIKLLGVVPADLTDADFIFA